MLVVNKPASIALHPSGRFRHNTVLFILAHERHLAHVHTVHRLDRLTSGLLLIAKTDDKAREVSADINQGRVMKHYFAKVPGEFPTAMQTVEQPIAVFQEGVSGLCLPVKCTAYAALRTWDHVRAGRWEAVQDHVPSNCV